jgi:hypothetical protein
MRRPWLCHHARKHTDRNHQPIELDDLSFAGIAEFSRQWILQSRRDPYEPGTGSHRLWLVAGNSAGDSGVWALDVEEGQNGLDPDPDSPVIRLDARRWEVAVRHATQQMQDDRQRKEATRLEAKERAKAQALARIAHQVETRRASRGI